MPRRTKKSSQARDAWRKSVLLRFPNFCANSYRGDKAKLDISFKDFIKMFIISNDGDRSVLRCPHLFIGGSQVSRLLGKKFNNRNLHHYKWTKKNRKKGLMAEYYYSERGYGNMSQAIYRHKQYPWIFSKPDLYNEEEGEFIEVKMFDEETGFGERIMNKESRLVDYQMRTLASNLEQVVKLVVASKDKDGRIEHFGDLYYSPKKLPFTTLTRNYVKNVLVPGYEFNCVGSKPVISDGITILTNYAKKKHKRLEITQIRRDDDCLECFKPPPSSELVYPLFDD